MRQISLAALVTLLLSSSAYAAGSTAPGIVQSGAVTAGHCAQFSAAGVQVDSGNPCGTGTAGVTQSTGASGQVLVNGDTSAHTGATTYSLAPAVVLGTPGSAAGSVGLAGSTSGTATVAGPASGGGTNTLPAGTNTLVGRTTTDTLTNKGIDGATNTLTNIGNGALTNSSITIGGQSTALGGSTTNQGNGAKIQLSTGTPATDDCGKFDANHNIVSAGAPCGSGTGGSLTVTDGTTSVGSTTTLTVGNGLVVTGSGGSAALGLTSPANAFGSSHTVIASDMGATMNLTSTGTLTIGAISGTVFAAGMPSCYSNVGTGTWTISSTPTINGLPSTSLVPGAGGCLLSNGTSLDWQPGMSLPSSARLGGVRTTALAAHNFATAVSGSTGDLTGAQPGAADLSASGTASASTFLRGDNTWSTPAGGGNVSTSGSPANGNLAKFTGTTTVSNGDLSGDCTTSGTLAIACTKTGGVNFGTAATVNTGSSGATIPLLNGTNVWSGQNSGCVATLTATSNTYTPAGTCNHYKLTLAATNTIANPSVTPVAGTDGTIQVIQDATGSRTVTWGSQYYIEGGVSGVTLSTGASAFDVFAYHVLDSTHILLTFASKGATH